MSREGYESQPWLSAEEMRSEIDWQALLRDQADRIYDWQTEQEKRTTNIKEENEAILYERMLKKNKKRKSRKSKIV